LTVLALAGGVALVIVGRGTNQAKPPSPSLVVDLNTAPPEVLATLPRLGPVLVERIVTARRDAPFRSLEELDARVKGIGPAAIAAIRPYVRFAEPPNPHFAASALGR
jgi:competence protein ComEA